MAINNNKNISIFPQTRELFHQKTEIPGIFDTVEQESTPQKNPKNISSPTFSHVFQASFCFKMPHFEIGNFENG